MRIGTFINEYIITDIYENSKIGFARGYKEWKDGSVEYATWAYNPETVCGYCCGHYMMTEKDSFDDFLKRIREG